MHPDVRHYERRVKGLGMGRAARILRVPIPTLRSWMNQGKVPGVQKTEGGHRWISREGLLAFARERGVAHLVEDKRRHPRVEARKLRLELWMRCPRCRHEIFLGEGRLRDLSLSGFRADRLGWRTAAAPAQGARLRFRVPGGRLEGVEGFARVAWHQDNRRERGATLGAELKQLEGVSRTTWKTYLRVDLN